MSAFCLMNMTKTIFIVMIMTMMTMVMMMLVRVLSDDNDNDGNDDEPRVACLCVCFVCALSSHIRHTPPHPLLGQDHHEDADADEDEEDHEDMNKLYDDVDHLFSSGSSVKGQLDLQALKIGVETYLWAFLVFHALMECLGPL